jgi:ribosomal-protein-alanine N-acetyltransferase
MTELTTARLRLRRLTLADAPFILALLTDPQWQLHIGDRGVRNLQDAELYIRTGPLTMYEQLGFGLWVVELLPGSEAIGLCGLLKRDYLDDLDLGFAFLPAHRGKGYALEAARGTIAYARERLGRQRLAAITSQTNHASVKLLGRLGFRFERMLRAPPKDEELKLFVATIADGS